MKFACLTGVAPGADLTEQCAAIAATGCQGIETILFPTTPLDAWTAELTAATDAAGLETAVVILGQLALYAHDQSGWIGEALAAAGEVGAAALITPEYRPQNPLPLFPPFPAPSPAERARVEEAVNEIIDRAGLAGVTVLFEPITQFEGRFWRTIRDILPVCRQLEGRHEQPNWGVVVDFHNMNITEADPVQAIHAAGAWIKHVHLADNNRRLPGMGHLDFGAGLKALRDTGYDGWYSFECAVGHDFVAEVRRSIAYLRRSESAP